ncbi:bifunctional diguanylate cyclase/phosphodiesterase [Mangrovitalea sediminis]|uniref:bifunctional diguanylate cyclase/phosphodiesterase n=1 Tax=Mangrovitalea sediminis TaxID=1982043 RepID=UPI000BE50251|nr:EAL domain-containing protein [Mangrovitalea sediminis]
MTQREARAPYRLKTLLLTFTGILMLVLLAGSFYVSFERFRAYLSLQLQEHAQDAATALGLSLSNAIDGRDPVASSLAIDAMFDSGDYRSILYLDVNGQEVAGRRAGDGIEGVPPWFVHLVHLPFPQGQAQVVHGWQQLGRVIVTGSPARAYRDLWASLRNQTLWYLAIAILALFLLYRMVRLILRPLLAMEHQANAIRQRDFSVHVPLPQTRELRKVSLAMNQMADDLGVLFDGQLKLIEQLRLQSTEDQVTGLFNRSTFDQRLRAELESEDGIGTGTLILIQLAYFADFNHARGRQAGDAVLQQMAGVVDEFVTGHSSAFAGRRGGAEFVLFLPGIGMVDAEHWLSDLILQLERVYSRVADAMTSGVHAGLAASRGGLKASELLSRADAALRQAQDDMVSGFRHYDEELGGVEGAERWRQILQDALDGERIHLLFQPARNIATGDTAYYQVLSRVEVDSEWVTASVFIPLAERFALVSRLDRLVFDLALKWLEAHPGVFLSLSVATASVGDDDFLDGLQRLLRRVGDLASRVWMTVPEQVVRLQRSGFEKLLRIGGESGAKVMVDRFGVGGVPFNYLRQLPVQGIRIDRSYIRDIDKHPENLFFIQSILPIAHGRGVKVWVNGVETAAEWDLLRKQPIDGGMGYHLGRPQEAPENGANP